MRERILSVFFTVVSQVPRTTPVIQCLPNKYLLSGWIVLIKLNEKDYMIIYSGVLNV